jgi:hypothetical protein
VHLETFHAVRGLGQAVPVGHVKFEGMQGAAGDAATKPALPEGPGLVRTGVMAVCRACGKGPPAARSH